MSREQRVKMEDAAERVASAAGQIACLTDWDTRAYSALCRVAEEIEAHEERLRKELDTYTEDE